MARCPLMEEDARLLVTIKRGKSWGMAENVANNLDRSRPAHSLGSAEGIYSGTVRHTPVFVGIVPSGSTTAKS